MKKTALIFFFISSLSYAQSLQEKVENQVCKCFNDNDLSLEDAFKSDVLPQCFAKAIGKLEDDFIAEYTQHIDTTSTKTDYQKGQEYGKKLFTDMQHGLIKTCDSYYQLMSLLKKEMYVNFGKGASLKKRDSITRLMNENPTQTKLLIMRGMYNLGINDLEKAQEDIENFIDTSDDNNNAYFLLGFIYDIKEDSKNALIYYNKIEESGTNIGAFNDIALIFKAILKRKLTE